MQASSLQAEGGSFYIEKNNGYNTIGVLRGKVVLVSKTDGTSIALPILTETRVNSKGQASPSAALRERHLLQSWHDLAEAQQSGSLVDLFH